MPEDTPTPKKSLKELEKERKLLENKEKKKLETKQEVGSDSNV